MAELATETQQGSPFSLLDFFNRTINSMLSLALFSQEGEKVDEITSSQESNVTDDTHFGDLRRFQTNLQHRRKRRILDTSQTSINNDKKTQQMRSQ